MAPRAGGAWARAAFMELVRGGSYVENAVANYTRPGRGDRRDTGVPVAGDSTGWAAAGLGGVQGPSRWTSALSPLSRSLGTCWEKPPLPPQPPAAPHSPALPHSPPPWAPPRFSQSPPGAHGGAAGLPGAWPWARTRRQVPPRPELLLGVLGTHGAALRATTSHSPPHPRVGRGPAAVTEPGGHGVCPGGRGAWQCHPPHGPLGWFICSQDDVKNLMSVHFCSGHVPLPRGLHPTSPHRVTYFRAHGAGLEVGRHTNEMGDTRATTQGCAVAPRTFPSPQR